MFPDSKIVNKYRCGLTNTTHMLIGAVAKQITSNLKEEYGLATDGSSDEGDKFLQVLVRYVDKDSGLIATSLLGIDILAVAQQYSNCMMCAMK